MSSTLATVVVPALSAVGGALLGAYASGRQQRAVQLRQRMLDTASDLIDAVHRATAVLTEEPVDELRDVADAMKDARIACRRVDLIFGPDSAAAINAFEAVSDISVAVDGCQVPYDIDPRVEDSDDVAKRLWDADREKERYTAERSLDDFARLAGRAIRTGGRHPALDRTSRRIRTLRHRSRLRRVREAGQAYRDATAQLREVDIEYRRMLDTIERGQEQSQ